MPYSVWQAFITDGGEQVVPAATIDVYLEASGAPATIYDGPSGASLGSSTVSGADGLAKFFAPAGTYKIVATKGAFTKEFRHVQLGNAAARDTGVAFDNVPTVSDADTLYIRQDELAVAEGVATLDADGRLVQNINAAGIVGTISAGNLPSYVDDVLEYADLAAFPGTGETGKIYLAQDTGASYRWTGTVYLKLSDDDVLEFANLAAFPASGVGAALYIAADTGLLYRWNGAAYVSMGLSAIPAMTMLGNNTGGSAAPAALTQAQVRDFVGSEWNNAAIPAQISNATTTPAATGLTLDFPGAGTYEVVGAAAASLSVSSITCALSLGVTNVSYGWLAVVGIGASNGAINSQFWKYISPTATASHANSSAGAGTTYVYRIAGIVTVTAAQSVPLMFAASAAGTAIIFKTDLPLSFVAWRKLP